MTIRKAEAVGRLLLAMNLDAFAAAYRHGSRDTRPVLLPLLDALAELLQPDARPVIRPNAALVPLPWVVTCGACGRLSVKDRVRENDGYVECDYCAEDDDVAARPVRGWV